MRQKTLWKLLCCILTFCVTSQVWALPNDRFGRTVTLATANGTDTYTDTDPNNSNQTFQLSFPQGTDQNSVVYPALNAIGPPPSMVHNYAGLDASSVVLTVNLGVTQAIMDALVSGGTIASYQLLDPTFPAPAIGSTFVAGAGQGNFMPPPIPFFAATPANWPPPGGVPNVINQAINQLATRLSNVNPSVPARSLASTFVPNANRPTYDCYSVQIQCPVSVSACTGTVRMLVDSATPPVQIVQEAALSRGAVSTAADYVTIPLCYMVPTGFNVRINTIVGAGSPTFTLTRQIEEAIH